MTRQELDEAMSSLEKETGFDCLNYWGLPAGASLKNRILAIQKDQQWMKDWAEEIDRKFDGLLQEITP